MNGSTVVWVRFVGFVVERVLGLGLAVSCLVSDCLRQMIVEMLDT